jgi:Xaa-Pro aminopeptidase
MLLSSLATISLSLLAALPQQRPDDGRGQELFNKDWHAARRAALMEGVKSSVVILRGQGTQNDYREFRQDNNFFYFTGVITPNAILVMAPKKDGSFDEWMFVPPVSGMDERWMGNLVDPGEAKEITGIENCMALGPRSRTGQSFVNLQKLLTGLSERFDSFAVQQQPAENWMMSRDNLQSWARATEGDPYDGRVTREAQFAKMLGQFHGVEVKDITVRIDAMRIVKTPEEVEAMRRSCQASAAAHTAVWKTAMPGDYEWQLATRMSYEFEVAGAMGAGYMAIVGSGLNACTLHYNENNRQLENEEIVMIDYGAEYRHYVADISRSFPTGRKFTARQREVYEAVYAAQEAAFKECKPGSSLGKVDAAARRVLTERGFGDAFWHGTSHWLGMATHDVGGRGGSGFMPGMAFTVEPGVYLPEEGIGVRIEDVVVITEDGYELISSVIPRDIETIEAMRGEAWDAAEAKAAAGN